MNHFDLAQWIAHAFVPPGQAGYDPQFDLNGDTLVNRFDLALLIPRLFEPVMPLKWGGTGQAASGPDEGLVLPSLGPGGRALEKHEAVGSQDGAEVASFLGIPEEVECGAAGSRKRQDHDDPALRATLHDVALQESVTSSRSGALGADPGGLAAFWLEDLFGHGSGGVSNKRAVDRAQSADELFAVLGKPGDDRSV